MYNTVGPLYIWRRLTANRLDPFNAVLSPRIKNIFYVVVCVWLTTNHDTRINRSRPSLQIVSMSSSAGEANLPYRYRWPRPAVTVDCLIYTLEEREPWILLIKRKNDPFKGSWALPGKEGREVVFEKAYLHQLNSIARRSSRGKDIRTKVNIAKKVRSFLSNFYN